MADIIEPIAEFRAMSETKIMAALELGSLAGDVVAAPEDPDPPTPSKLRWSRDPSWRFRL
jgi:hypothetical protein